MKIRIDDIIIQFPVLYIKEKLRKKGFRENERNILLVMENIRQHITEKQLVSSVIEDIFQSIENSMEKALEN